MRRWLPCIAALTACGWGDVGPGPAEKGPRAVAVAATTGPEAVRRARLIESYADLTVGDAPYRFRAVVERNNGRVDTLQVPVVLRDSGVARIVDGAVEALAMGQAQVFLDIAPGMRQRGVVNVSERIFADSVWLSPGQVRAWDLQPSWYRITVDAKAPPGQAQPLELAADLICVPDSRGPKETIMCRVRQNTRVLLRHNGVRSGPGPALAVVTIMRVPR